MERPLILVPSIKPYCQRGNIADVRVLSSVKWKDASSKKSGPVEFSFETNCDKVLHHLDWQATWDFVTTIEQQQIGTIFL